MENGEATFYSTVVSGMTALGAVIFTLFGKKGETTEQGRTNLSKDEAVFRADLVARLDKQQERLDESEEGRLACERRNLELEGRLMRLEAKVHGDTAHGV